MVRITNARRPRIRPRSSLTPTAPIPPPIRPVPAAASARPRPGDGRAGRRTRRRSVIAGGSSGRSCRSWSLLGRLERLAVGGGDLQEELLEVARGAGEADDRQAGRDGRGQQPGRGLVVAAEAELDRAVLEDRRRRDVRVGGEAGRGRPRAPRPRAAAGRAARHRSAAAARCRPPGPGRGPGRGRRSRRSCTAPRARAGCGC